LFIFLILYHSSGGKKSTATPVWTRFQRLEAFVPMDSMILKRRHHDPPPKKKQSFTNVITNSVEVWVLPGTRGLPAAKHVLAVWRLFNEN